MFSKELAVVILHSEQYRSESLVTDRSLRGGMGDYSSLDAMEWKVASVDLQVRIGIVIHLPCSEHACR